MESIFWLCLGAFVGWNLPQPVWAKYIQSKIIDTFNKSK